MFFLELLVIYVHGIEFKLCMCLLRCVVRFIMRIMYLCLMYIFNVIISGSIYNRWFVRYMMLFVLYVYKNRRKCLLGSCTYVVISFASCNLFSLQNSFIMESRMVISIHTLYNIDVSLL